MSTNFPLRNDVNGPEASGGELLALRGVIKRFGGVAALGGVDFDLRRGEIHALLGENGAGKSTLIKVLGGIHIPDAGTIHVDGQPARIRRVADADRHGIRLIHQELSLSPNLSIADNIYMGREPHRLGLLLRRRMHADARALIASLGLDELPAVETQVSRLTVAQQQLVEIARALSCRARILVLDEPTSSLSVAETEALFVTLQRLRSQGVGIIYISHRLEEIARLADRITVLRDGKAVGTQPASQLNRRELVQWMVGHTVQDELPRPTSVPGEAALKVSGLRNAAIHDVSFELRYGEILGLAGLVGSGRSELARAIFGIDRLHSGEILLDGRPQAIRGPRDALGAGIVLVPEDRKVQGLVMTHSAGFNLALPWLREWIGLAGPSQRRRQAIIDRAIQSFAIRTADPELRIDSLSGGNQQKVLVGRWMEQRPKVLILDEPTRGVDVAAREEMFQIIASLVQDGLAVLLISSDLSEVLGMSHRVAVYRDGRILQTADARQITMADVLEQLTGAQAGEDR
jgi:ribose transport system ATP-binding protein